MDERPNRRDTLVKAVLYIEGGGDSKELHSRCKEAFRSLIERSGFRGRMPRLVACGGREQVFDDFSTALKNRQNEFVAMLIDSEDPVANLERTWSHLKTRDNWHCPENAGDEQVLFMTTCMESWIATDRPTLKEHYGADLQESALPSSNEIELKGRHQILGILIHATRNCSNAYLKGKRSFEILGKLSPDVLEKHLPSFRRFKRILTEKIPG